jgi:hypothetical protein
MHHDIGLPAERKIRLGWCLQKLYYTLINQPVLETKSGFNLAEFLASKFKEDKQGLATAMSMVMSSLLEAKERGRQDEKRDLEESVKNRGVLLVTPPNKRKAESEDEDGATKNKARKVARKEKRREGRRKGGGRETVNSG